MSFGYHRVARTVSGLAVSAALAGFAAFAQTPLQIATFRQEITIPLANIGAAAPAAIPADILATLVAGQKEVRHSASFDPATSLLTIDLFLVNTGAPASTSAANRAAGRIEMYTVKVSNVTVATTPRNLVTFFGTVDSVPAPSPFGALAGSPVFYSFGWQRGDTSKINNTTLVIPGLATAFVAGSTGTLTFTNAPGTPSDNKPPVADAGRDITAVVSQVQLDASASSDPEGDAVTYSWRIVGRSATIIGPTTAKPTVQLGEGFGNYVFEVTVKDSKGAESTDTVNVFYIGRF